MKERCNTQKRGLDSLRGIGIIGIVFYHLFPSVVRGGFLGVPLFFVLSGYLMFVTSQRRHESGGFSIQTYYKKRLRKILPPLFVMVMVVCCFLTLTKSSELIGIREELCSIFFGYDNWWQIQQCASYFSKLSTGSPFTHLWFLAVEIQFYLLWPVLFLFYKKCCCRIGEKKMCFLFLLLALLSAGKMYFLYIPYQDPSRVYYGTDTMAFSLFLGIFLAALRQAFPRICSPVPRKWTAIYFFCFGIITTTLFLVIDGQFCFLYQGGMFLISLFFAAAIHIIENSEISNDRFFKNSPLSIFGKKSYGIYLWHYPLIVLGIY